MRSMATSVVGCWWETGAGADSTTVGSGDLMSAFRPLPSAFLVIRNHLLGELDIAGSAAARGIIKQDGFAMAGRLCQAHVAGNNCLKDLRTKETAQVGGDLAGKRSPFVVHREDDALDFQILV